MSPFLLGDSVAVAQQDTLDGTRHDFRDVDLDAHIRIDAEGAEMAKARRAAVADFEWRGIVWVRHAGHAVVDVACR